MTRTAWIGEIERVYDAGFSAVEGDLVSRVARLHPSKGDWTVHYHYVCMRAFGEGDVFVASDLGLNRALGLEKGTPK